MENAQNSHERVIIKLPRPNLSGAQNQQQKAEGETPITDYYGLLSNQLASVGENMSPKHLEAAAGELRFVDTDAIGGNGAYFNTIFDNLRSQYGLTEGQAEKIIGKYATSLKQSKAEKQQKAAARINVIKKAGLAIATGLFLGAGIGGGVSVYNATHNAALQSAIAERTSNLKTAQSKLDEAQKALTQKSSTLERDLAREYSLKTAEIQKRFFGTLETLLASDNSTLSAFERKAYTEEIFGHSPDVNPNIIYNQIDQKTGIRVLGKLRTSSRPSGWSTAYTPTLSITRLSADNKIMSVHTYTTAKEFKGKVPPSLPEIYASAEPSQTLLFSGAEAISVNHRNNSVEKYFNGDKVYGNAASESATFYNNMAKKLLSEFEMLSNRGPLSSSPVSSPASPQSPK